MSRRGEALARPLRDRGAPHYRVEFDGNLIARDGEEQEDAQPVFVDPRVGARTVDTKAKERGRAARKRRRRARR